MADQTVPDSGGPETFIPETLGQKIFDAARQVYEQWRTTPNRDAYVGVHIERAARAAVDAVALDLMAAGRAQAAADLRAMIDDLTDPDPCGFDHHGHCQAHGWTKTEPRCPHARAKDVLAEESP